MVQSLDGKIGRAISRLAPAPIVVATHPRSGTHLMIDALRWRCRDCGVWKFPREPLERQYVTVDQLARLSQRRSKLAAAYTLLRSRRALVKTHRLPGLKPWLLPPRHGQLHPLLTAWLLETGCFLHVYRDGRDAVWSYYLLARHSGALANVTFAEFLRRPSPSAPWGGAARSWAAHVRSWRSEADVFQVEYAQLLATPEPTLQRVADHIGIDLEARVPPLPPRARGASESALWQKRTGHPPSTAVLGPDAVQPRRSWRDVFSREDGRVFERESEGLLVELGYERSHTWWKELRRER